MRAALQAVGWEIGWRNRLSFAVTGALLVLGAGLTRLVVQAPATAWWVDSADRFILIACLGSLGLGVAPFLLMESQGGWRMNSMTTRWFTLPIGTWNLVWLPAVSAWTFVTVLVLAWGQVLRPIAGGLDAWHLARVFGAGIVVVQALAWTVPRKPVQFWIGVAVLFPVIVILGLGPQDQPGTEVFRRWLRLPLALATGGALVVAAYAARRNRCGDWPGEVPFDTAFGWWRGGRRGATGQGRFRSAGLALFWSDGRPALRLLAIGWVSLAVVVWGYVALFHPDPSLGPIFSRRRVLLLAVSVMPVFGVMAMAAWGLLVGCEPAGGFRTRLTSFRATLPVNAGGFAAVRLATILLGWGLVWLPIVGAAFAPGWDFRGSDPVEVATTLRTILVRFLVVGLQVAVGLLPLCLLGRIEGFPNVFLVSLCSWMGVWLVISSLGGDEEAGRAWWLLASLLLVKFGAAGVGLYRGFRVGQFDWRFPLGLLAVWLGVVASLVWGLPSGQRGGLWASLLVVLLTPLARPAWCPTAVAANRHR